MSTASLSEQAIKLLCRDYETERRGAIEEAKTKWKAEKRGRVPTDIGATKAMKMKDAKERYIRVVEPSHMAAAFMDAYKDRLVMTKDKTTTDANAAKKRKIIFSVAVLDDTLKKILLDDFGLCGVTFNSVQPTKYNENLSTKEKEREMNQKKTSENNSTAATPASRNNSTAAASRPPVENNDDATPASRNNSTAAASRPPVENNDDATPASNNTTAAASKTPVDNNDDNTPEPIPTGNFEFPKRQASPRVLNTLFCGRCHEKKQEEDNLHPLCTFTYNAYNEDGKAVSKTDVSKELAVRWDLTVLQMFLHDKDCCKEWENDCGEDEDTEEEPEDSDDGSETDTEEEPEDNDDGSETEDIKSAKENAKGIYHARGTSFEQKDCVRSFGAYIKPEFPIESIIGETYSTLMACINQDTQQKRKPYVSAIKTALERKERKVTKVLQEYTFGVPINNGGPKTYEFSDRTFLVLHDQSLVKAKILDNTEQEYAIARLALWFCSMHNLTEEMCPYELVVKPASGEPAKEGKINRKGKFVVRSGAQNATFHLYIGNVVGIYGGRASHSEKFGVEKFHQPCHRDDIVPPNYPKQLFRPGVCSIPLEDKREVYFGMPSYPSTFLTNHPVAMKGQIMYFPHETPHGGITYEYDDEKVHFGLHVSFDSLLNPRSSKRYDNNPLLNPYPGIYMPHPYYSCFLLKEDIDHLLQEKKKEYDAIVAAQKDRRKKK